MPNECDYGERIATLEAQFTFLTQQYNTLNKKIDNLIAEVQQQGNSWHRLRGIIVAVSAATAFLGSIGGIVVGVMMHLLK